MNFKLRPLLVGCYADITYYWTSTPFKSQNIFITGNIKYILTHAWIISGKTKHNKLLFSLCDYFSLSLSLTVCSQEHITSTVFVEDKTKGYCWTKNYSVKRVF